MGVVQRCMTHGSWDFVTLYRPWVMGKKSLNGVNSSLLLGTLDSSPSSMTTAVGRLVVAFVWPMSPDGLFVMTSWWERGELNFVILQQSLSELNEELA